MYYTGGALRRSVGIAPGEDERMPKDVIIVGAGIVGAACARALAMDGFEVTVVDRGTVAGGTSSACEGNLLVSDKGPGAELDLARYASGLWQRTVEDLRDQLGPESPSVEYDAKGGLVAATTDTGAQSLLAFAASQRAVGIDAQVLDAREARALEPDLAPDIRVAVLYPEDAQVQPTIATEALLASARRHGARVLENRAVTGPVLDPSGCLAGVATSAGDRLTASRVLIAAGPWSGDVAALFGLVLPVRPRRGELLVTSRMRHRIFHKVYDADYVGAVGSGDSALQTSSVVESTAAGTVLIGSSRQQVGFDSRLQVDALAGIAAKALRLFPFLAGATVMRTYGGFRPYMPDHLPLIGEDPRLPGLWHATGHEGAGIGLSLATAAMFRDLMTGRSPALPVGPFSLSRPSLAAALERAA
jgi:glycine/D-amino acid oxidase-like deaminating enzyme